MKNYEGVGGKTTHIINFGTSRSRWSSGIVLATGRKIHWFKHIPDTMDFKGDTSPEHDLLRGKKKAVGLM
jgi:hypothetical protein